MNLLSPISDLMTTNLVTIASWYNIQSVDKIFQINSFHHLPVVDNDKLIGIVSKSDLNLFKRGFFKSNEQSRLDLHRLKSYRVADIMTTGVATLEPDDKINVALDVFSENLFHSIPVVQDGVLLGMVTTYDIIKRLADDKGAVNKYMKAC
jgi:acetoin utilization protein AcuB